MSATNLNQPSGQLARVVLGAVVRLAVLAAFICSPRVRGAESFYAKKATRDETKAASVATVEALLGESGYRLLPWQALGPFNLEAQEWHLVPLPPDGTVNLNASYVGAGGQSVRWQPWATELDGTGVSLISLAPAGKLAYAARRIVADREMKLTIFSGSSGMVMWVNGERVLVDPGPQSITVDANQTLVTLRPGTNVVLIKAGSVGWSCAFQFRVSSRTREELARRQQLLDDIENRLQLDFPIGEAAYYQVETIQIPPAIVLEVSALATKADGSIFVATRRGEIWTVDLAKQIWLPFATGLHEPLGLLIENDHQIVVAQRPELTRIKDTDLDGTADVYETVTAQFGLSGNFHEFHYGPVRDAAGNLYGTLNLTFNGGMRSAEYLRGWAYKITPAGQFIPYALGFRSPNGIGVSPDGDIFVVDSQGEWFGASPLIHLQQGKFYGHPASLRWTQSYRGNPDPNLNPPAALEPLKTPPAAWFVYGPLGQAPGQPVWDTTGGKFGPFSGQMFVGDVTKSLLLRVALEKVAGEWQGAIFPFRTGFVSGLTRSTWLNDGTLLVGMTSRGWSSTGGRSFGLQRVIWTGTVPMEIQSMKLTKTGFDLSFTKPLDPGIAAATKSYSLKYFHYAYLSSYGSPRQGETPVVVSSSKLSTDRKTVSLTLPNLVAGKIY